MNHFTIQPEGTRFRIQDNETRQLTKGRFHTFEQAQEWVNTEIRREAWAAVAFALGATKGHPSRGRAHLLTPAVQLLALKSSGWQIPEFLKRFDVATPLIAAMYSESDTFDERRMNE